MTSNTDSIIIADSSALVSFLNPDDANYAKATHLVTKLTHKQGKILIPEEVFTETVNVIGRKLGHQVATATAWELYDSTVFLVLVNANHDVLRQALTIFANQPDSVSLTDCLVMALADVYATRTILGFDAVFARNGYALPQV